MSAANAYLLGAAMVIAVLAVVIGVEIRRGIVRDRRNPPPLGLGTWLAHRSERTSCDCFYCRKWNAAAGLASRDTRREVRWLGALLEIQRHRGEGGGGTEEAGRGECDCAQVSDCEDGITRVINKVLSEAEPELVGQVRASLNRLRARKGAQ